MYTPSTPGDVFVRLCGGLHGGHRVKAPLPVSHPHRGAIRRGPILNK